MCRRGVAALFAACFLARACSMLLALSHLTMLCAGVVMTTACSGTDGRDLCLSLLGAGHWDAQRVWRWNDDVPACCRLGHVGPKRAAALLRGRQVVFVGDSQSRRHLWAVVDAVGGEHHAIRRRSGQVVLDSHREFDAAAVALNDTLYDSQRAYHAGQTVLLNVETGRWVLLDPLQLCGVARKYWMVDHRLTSALSRGQPPPWHTMRGSQYRLRLRIAPRRVGVRGVRSLPDGAIVPLHGLLR